MKLRRPPRGKELHQMETLVTLQRAERIHTRAEAARERAVEYEEQAKLALDEARKAHKRLVS